MADAQARLSLESRAEEIARTLVFCQTYRSIRDAILAFAREAIAERDSLWCESLVTVLNPDGIHAVTAEFNRRRPDKVTP